MVAATLLALATVAAGHGYNDNKNDNDLPDGAKHGVYLLKYELDQDAVKFVVKNSNDYDKDLGDWEIRIIKDGEIAASTYLDEISADGGNIYRIDWETSRGHADEFDRIELIDAHGDKSVFRVPSDMEWWIGAFARIERSGSGWHWNAYDSEKDWEERDGQ